MPGENQNPQNQKQEERRLHKEVVRQMVVLATNGFGLVAALAWNNVIQEFINEYIKKNFSFGSGLVSLFIYAILITSLAVAVTYNLTRLSEKLGNSK